MSSSMNGIKRLLLWWSVLTGATESSRMPGNGSFR